MVFVVGNAIIFKKSRQHYICHEKIIPENKAAEYPKYMYNISIMFDFSLIKLPGENQKLRRFALVFYFIFFNEFILIIFVLFNDERKVHRFRNFKII